MYHFQPVSDLKNVMYGPIMGVDDLDKSRPYVGSVAYLGNRHDDKCRGAVPNPFTAKRSV